MTLKVLLCEMRKIVIVLLFISLFVLYSCLVKKPGTQSLYELRQMTGTNNENDSLVILTPGFPDILDDSSAYKGYQYLLYGDGFSSGIPYSLYKILLWAKKTKLSQLGGYSRYALNGFTVFNSEFGKKTVTAGCLHCHSQQFNEEWVIGMGNSYTVFDDNKLPYAKWSKTLIMILYGKNSNEWKTAERSIEAASMLSPLIRTEARGTASAHRIAELLASHRDPVTLEFRADTTYFPVPSIVIPEDVPPLWNFRKKKSSFINAMGQGDITKHLMCGTTISLADTFEARKIYNNFKNVWAFLNTLEPLKYPEFIDAQLAQQGKSLFIDNCSSCHGTYGEQETYPNKLVPASEIGTDSLMLKYYANYPEYADWFNKSWLATSSPAGYIKPQYGYVAPPLDGVWCTAPYFHNGSVPTIEGVLNSDLRPRYWKRNFTKEKYDYDKLGWQHKTLSRPGNHKTYNTDIPGYGNYGHYFGDHFTEAERKAVIEYIKTL